jgi:hypothetical protein
MSAWFASGQVIDAILMLMVAEGALLCAIRARYGRGLSVGTVATLLASGGALMLALRAALTGAPWETVSAFLVAGLIAHLIDVARFQACGSNLNQRHFVRIRIGI